MSDSEDSDSEVFAVAVGSLLSSPSSHYEVQEVLGSGTYGDVAQCRKLATNQTVAVKILKTKNHFKLAKREVSILRKMKVLGSDKFNIIQLNDSFTFEGRFCLEFDKLDRSLFDLLEGIDSSSLELMAIRPIMQQLATALEFLESIGIVHADLKPENIMMVDHLRQPLRLKVIDFGLACNNPEDWTGASIQTLWYRAPEVLLGLPFNKAIDVWSLGCIAMEMFNGDALFPGNDEYDTMKHIVHSIGKPPDYLLNHGMYTKQYFIRENKHTHWRFKTASEAKNSSSNLCKITVVANLEKESGALSGEDAGPGERDWACFVDLVKKTLDLESSERITPSQILQHPFITMRHLVGRFNNSYHVKKCIKLMKTCDDLSSTDEDEVDQATLKTCWIDDTSNDSTSLTESGPHEFQPRSPAYSPDKVQPCIPAYSPDEVQPHSSAYSPDEVQPHSSAYSHNEVQPRSSAYSPDEVQPHSSAYSPDEVQPHSSAYSHDEVQPYIPSYSPDEVQPHSSAYSHNEVQPYIPAYSHDEVQPHSSAYSPDEVQPHSSAYSPNEVQPHSSAYSPDKVQPHSSAYSPDEVQPHSSAYRGADEFQPHSSAYRGPHEIQPNSPANTGHCEVQPQSPAYKSLYKVQPHSSDYRGPYGVQPHSSIGPYKVQPYYMSYRGLNEVQPQCPSYSDLNKAQPYCPSYSGLNEVQPYYPPYSGLNEAQPQGPSYSGLNEAQPYCPSYSDLNEVQPYCPSYSGLNEVQPYCPSYSGLDEVQPHNQAYSRPYIRQPYYPVYNGLYVVQPQSQDYSGPYLAQPQCLAYNGLYVVQPQSQVYSDPYRVQPYWPTYTGLYEVQPYCPAYSGLDEVQPHSPVYSGPYEVQPDPDLPIVSVENSPATKRKRDGLDGYERSPDITPPKKMRKEFLDADLKETQTSPQKSPLQKRKRDERDQCSSDGNSPAKKRRNDCLDSERDEADLWATIDGKSPAKKSQKKRLDSERDKADLWADLWATIDGNSPAKKRKKKCLDSESDRADLGATMAGNTPAKKNRNECPDAKQVLIGGETSKQKSKAMKRKKNDNEPCAILGDISTVKKRRTVNISKELTDVKRLLRETDKATPVDHLKKRKRASLHISGSKSEDNLSVKRRKNGSLDRGEV